MSSIVEHLKTTVKSAARHGDSFDSVERKTLKPLENDADPFDLWCSHNSDSGHPARIGVRLEGGEFV